MKSKFLKESLKKMQYKFNLLQDITLVNGKIRSFMVKENFTLKMDPIMKVPSNMVLLRGRVDTYSITVAYMREK